METKQPIDAGRIPECGSAAAEASRPALPDDDRRKFIKASLLSVPVVLTLSAKSSLAQEVQVAGSVGSVGSTAATSSSVPAVEDRNAGLDGDQSPDQ